MPGARSGLAITPRSRRCRSPRPSAGSAYPIADGHTNKSTAKSLSISINTVGTHLRSIYSKLGVQSRVQLVNILRELGEIA